MTLLDGDLYLQSRMWVIAVSTSLSRHAVSMRPIQDCSVRWETWYTSGSPDTRLAALSCEYVLLVSMWFSTSLRFMGWKTAEPSFQTIGLGKLPSSMKTSRLTAPNYRSLSWYSVHGWTELIWEASWRKTLMSVIHWWTNTLSHGYKWKDKGLCYTRKF